MTIDVSHLPLRMGVLESAPDHRERATGRGCRVLPPRENASSPGSEPARTLPCTQVQPWFVKRPQRCCGPRAKSSCVGKLRRRKCCLQALPEMQGEFACNGLRLPCSSHTRSLFSDIREKRSNTLYAGGEMAAKTAVGTKKARHTLLFGVYQGNARGRDRLFKASLRGAGVTRKLTLGAQAVGRFSCLLCAESSRQTRVKNG